MQLQRQKEKVRAGQNVHFALGDDGTLYYENRICVPNVEDVKKEIMHEAHFAPYAMHPGSTKMYKDLKSHYWWSRMKKEIAKFISKCLTCQQIKAKHQAPSGKLQSLSIPE